MLDRAKGCNSRIALRRRHHVSYQRSEGAGSGSVWQRTRIEARRERDRTRIIQRATDHRTSTDAAPLTPAFEYFLSESRWIDVGTGGLAAVAAMLVEAVRLHLDTTVANEPRLPLDSSIAPRAATLSRWKWG